MSEILVEMRFIREFSVVKRQRLVLRQVIGSGWWRRGGIMQDKTRQERFLVLRRVPTPSEAAWSLVGARRSRATS